MPRQKRSVPWIDHRNGIYYACWYEPETRRTRRQTLSTDDAVLATQRFADWLNRGQRRASSPAEVTCGKLLDSYLTEHSEKKCVAHKRNKFSVKALKKHFTDLTPSEIDIPVCRAYTDLRRGDGVADSTIRRELAILNAALRHGVRWKYLTLDKLPLLEMPTTSTAKEVGYWTKDEIEKLRAAARELAMEKGGQFACLPLFIDLAYYTASRRKAIETLTKAQVNLATGRINLAKVGEKRTSKRRPIVPIAPEIRSGLEKALMDSPNDLVLGTSRDQFLTFQEVMKLAGLTGHPHMLRHSRATHLLQDGVEPYHVAALLGDSLQTVVRVYGHHCPDYLGTVIEERKAGALRAS